MVCYIRHCYHIMQYVSSLNTLAGTPLWWNKAEFNIPTCTLFFVIVVFVIPPFYSTIAVHHSIPLFQSTILFHYSSPPFYSTIAVHFSSPVIVDYLYSPSYMYQ